FFRSHSLDERLLACSETIEVRQVKFHPCSVSDNHVLVLTSDNMLRLYAVDNIEAHNLAVYPVGEKPVGMFPGSKTPFLDIYGEIAVDFDFGLPEVSEANLVYDLDDGSNASKLFHRYMEDWACVDAYTQTPEKIVPKSITNSGRNRNVKKWRNLLWPVYVLRGNCSVYSINIDLNKNRPKPVLKGPLPISPIDVDQAEACSIICLNSSPEIFCIAFSNGTLYHSLLLDIEQTTYDTMKQSAKSIQSLPTKEIVVFENVELELGLATSEDDYDTKYKCPIFLHKDESKVGRYFTTHSAGVHSVTISCVEELQNYVKGPEEDNDPTSDIFARPSAVEYLVCTKTTSSEKANPVIGFSPYYEPMSIITLLSDGSLLTLGILYASIMPKSYDLNLLEDRGEEVNSPLKKMLNEPFDQYIQKILKKSVTQPVLKLSSATNQSPEQCYELLQRAAQVFREEYFKQHTKAREEIEKRVQTLNMLKKNQQKEIDRMNSEKDILQEKASNLAEKYEDIKDKQDELLKRCENLLMLVSRKRCEASDAEKAFMKELKVSAEKVAAYGTVIDKIKNKVKYQQVQMENWRAQED
ncbi:hypothetical protein NQ315_010920, partial [Exocentrus adspersus]